jgi:Cell Wall Hydrolase
MYHGTSDGGLAAVDLTPAPGTASNAQGGVREPGRSGEFQSSDDGPSLMTAEHGPARSSRADAALMAALALVVLGAAATHLIAHYTKDWRGLAAPIEEVAVTHSPVALLREARALEARCLAEALYYEASGEGRAGQKAVAEVVLQRMRDGAFGATICAVVYDGAEPGRRSCQFSFACDGSLARARDPRAWAQAQILADGILSGAVALVGATGEAIAYHSRAVSPVWARTMEKTAEIGNHTFYRRAPAPSSLPAASNASLEIEAEIEIAGAVGDGA